MLIQSSCEKKIISVIKKLKKQNTKKMKQFQKIIFLMAILPFLFVTSCKDDDPAPATDNFTVLSDYLVANDLDLDDILIDWIKPAPAPEDLATFITDYKIYDIRELDDYNLGHIEGAIHSSLGEIVDDANGVTDRVMIACYTGQSASHAVVALRLSGHTTAVVLKWGMSGWTADLSTKWEANSGAVNGVYGISHNNWTNVSTPTYDEFAHPTFTTTSTDPATMLVERVKVMTDKGFQGVSSHTVIDTPADYFINNYWAQADVDRLGHIAEAYRINPLKLATDEFKNLDASKKVVTYCWTGQTSSMITAYLTIMGYDATSLAYGVNSLIWSDLQAGSGEPDAAHTFNGAPNDLEVQSN